MSPFSSEGNASNRNNDEGDLSRSMNENIDRLKDIFSYPINNDFVISEIYIPSLKKAGALIFISGMTDTDVIDRDILRFLTGVVKGFEFEDIDELSKYIPAAGHKMDYTMDEAVNEILQGNTIILVDGYNEALCMNTSSIEHRSVEQPTHENVIKGPHEAFIESGEINRALVRKYLRTSTLVTEIISIGQREKYRISMMYLRDVANKNTLEKVRERIRQVDSGNLITISMLEQNLEERPYSIVPTMMLTERPDRAASFIAEGHVILLMENSPYSLVVPMTFWGLFHTGEDMYQRWAYGNFLRIIRILGIMTALVTPAFYVAVTNYHPEMIPTDLLLAIASSREKVPFPVIFEVAIMEISFELIREAGVRIPSVLGPTIGIVGALIIGQAAVQANVVSPILVIIIALTGISSFTISNDSLNFMVRIGRFIFTIFAIFMGFLGLAICISCFTAYLTSIKSFGVPFFSPLAPYYKSNSDTIFRPPTWKRVLRPFNITPKDKTGQNPPDKSSA